MASYAEFYNGYLGTSSSSPAIDARIYWIYNDDASAPKYRLRFAFKIHTSGGTYGYPIGFEANIGGTSVTYRDLTTNFGSSTSWVNYYYPSETGWTAISTNTGTAAISATIYGRHGNSSYQRKNTASTSHVYGIAPTECSFDCADYLVYNTGVSSQNLILSNISASGGTPASYKYNIYSDGSLVASDVTASSYTISNISKPIANTLDIKVEAYSTLAGLTSHSDATKSVDIYYPGTSSDFSSFTVTPTTNMLEGTELTATLTISSITSNPEPNAYILQYYDGSKWRDIDRREKGKSTVSSVVFKTPAIGAYSEKDMRIAAYINKDVDMWYPTAVTLPDIYSSVPVTQTVVPSVSGSSYILEITPSYDDSSWSADQKADTTVTFEKSSDENTWVSFSPTESSGVYTMTISASNISDYNNWFIRTVVISTLNGDSLRMESASKQVLWNDVATCLLAQKNLNNPSEIGNIYDMNIQINATPSRPSASGFTYKWQYLNSSTWTNLVETTVNYINLKDYDVFVKGDIATKAKKIRVLLYELGEMQSTSNELQLQLTIIPLMKVDAAVTFSE